jgi:hypothetical protein
MHDEDKPIMILPTTAKSSASTPQISSNGLFIPYTINKKYAPKTNSSAMQSIKKSTSNIDDDDNDDDDDYADDTNQTDFLGLTKPNQIHISSTDVESVLRETFPKVRPAISEQPIICQPSETFEDLDSEQDVSQQTSYVNNNDDDDEVSLLSFL